MFFKLYSFALTGIQAIEVAVEVHIANGIPSFVVVGLPDKAVNESRQRVRAAIMNSGFKFPLKRITVNLSPADLRKEGAFYDLPIAVAIIAASSADEGFDRERVGSSSLVGELSLDGRVNPVKGIISMTEEALAKKKSHFLMPYDNVVQASAVKGNLQLHGCRHLLEAAEIFFGWEQTRQTGLLAEFQEPAEDTGTGNEIETGPESKHPGLNSPDDFSDIKGQLRAKRAAEVAVSGMHNIMMVGPPGSGKTMIARRMTSLMPELTAKESIEVTKIYSLYKGFNDRLIKERPFRNPHHTVSRMSFVGGGNIPRPGEISLAHRGVLFLDEFQLFPRLIVEDLRQPLEDKEIVISRNNLICRFPCSFMLVVAANPCICGHNGDPGKRCTCSEKEVKRYWDSISGPILDRIDMRIDVPRLETSDFFKSVLPESSYVIKRRVTRCHEVQAGRSGGQGIYFNSEAGINLIERWSKENESVKKILPGILEKYSLTGRGFSSLIKVARTIADMDHSHAIEINHVMEALNYRLGNHSC